MIDFEKLKEVLQKGIVEINFQSLKSNKTHSREYTLHPKFLPMKFQQSLSDKLIVWDVEFQKMEDIELETILSYTPLEKIS